MLIFTVCGFSNTGKTATVCQLVEEFTRRGYTVGTIKNSGCEQILFGDEGRDSTLHQQYGALRSAVRWRNGTAIFCRQQQPLADILAGFDQDIVVLEGFAASSIPKIVTAAADDQQGVKTMQAAFAMSGKIADTYDQYAGLPVYDCFKQTAELADLALANAWSGEPADWRDLL